VRKRIKKLARPKFVITTKFKDKFQRLRQLREDLVPTKEQQVTTNPTDTDKVEGTGEVAQDAEEKMEIQSPEEEAQIENTPSSLSDLLRNNDEGDQKSKKAHRSGSHKEDVSTPVTPKTSSEAKDDMEQWSDGLVGLLHAEDYPQTAPDDDLLLGEEHLTPQARRCPQAVRRLIRNAHRNLGHPSNFSLVKLMSVAKCHPDMIAYASQMKCETCLKRTPPGRIPRATMPYRPTTFNDTVGIDIK
jgi:hypothetical protein